MVDALVRSRNTTPVTRLLSNTVSELVRQSQIVQNAIDSYSTVVPKVLTPARFTSGLYLPGLCFKVVFSFKVQKLLTITVFHDSFWILVWSFTKIFVHFN